jgi:hypothetical protein
MSNLYQLKACLSSFKEDATFMVMANNNWNNLFGQL